MINNNSSPFNGLVSVILVLVLIGALAALALSGSDIVNFITNSAKAEGLRQENVVQAQKDVIDLRSYEAEQTAKSQAEAAKIAADAEAYERSLNDQAQFAKDQSQWALDLQKQTDLAALETGRFTRMVLSAAGALAVVILSLGGTVYLVLAGRSRLPAGQTTAKPGEVWQDRAWKRRQIAQARRQERLTRLSEGAAGAVETELSIPVEMPIPWKGGQSEPIEKQLPGKRGNPRNQTTGRR